MCHGMGVFQSEMSEIMKNAGLLAIGQAVEIRIVSHIWSMRWLFADGPNEGLELTARHLRMIVVKASDSSQESVRCQDMLA